MTEGIEFRQITADEFPEMARGMSRAIGFSPPSDDFFAVATKHYHPDRSVGGFDGGRLVGATYSHRYELTLPGGTLLVAGGVTNVFVASTHRRRGILNVLMRTQLEDLRERGEPVAILVASESVIYGRYGYGACEDLIEVEIDPRRGTLTHLPSTPGRVVGVDEETADKIFPDVYDRWRRGQPGAIIRDDASWEHWKRGRKVADESLLVYENESGEADGYARYKLQMRWDAGVPDHTVRVSDFVVCTEEARAGLYRTMLGVDLATTVAIGNVAVDDPIRWWLADPRQMKVKRFGDFLWLRPLNIEVLLGSRSYSADDRLVLGVTDAMFPDGAGAYAVSPDGCTRTDADPDIELDVGQLGAVSLGGRSFLELGRAGRITERTQGALHRADAMFAWSPRPWGNTYF